MAEVTKAETGWYRDRRGDEWHCVATDTSMVCNSTEYFTTAYHATFARWGWTRIDGPTPRTVCEALARPHPRRRS